MSKRYQYEPDNFSEIIPYVESEKETVVEKVCMSETLFFYDTCSLRYHAKLRDAESVFTFIKEHEGVVVIPRTIIMELSSSEETEAALLRNAEIRYLEKLNKKEIPIVIFDEEWAKDCLAYAHDENIGKRNNRIINVMKDFRNTFRSLQQCFQGKTNAEKSELMGNLPVTRDLIQPLLRELRESKQEGDSLGEELIYLIIALLADLGSQMYVFSDDRSSVFKYQKLREKMDNYGYENLKGQVCTPAFATTMLQKGVITFEQAKTLICSAHGNDQICKYTYRDGESFDVRMRNFTLEDVLEKMRNDAVFRILH